MDNNLLFLGGIFPDELREEIFRNSKTNVQHAADALQQSFIQGLRHYYPDLRVLNVPFVGSYPRRYRKAWVNPCIFSEGKGRSLGFLNVTGIKQIVIYRLLKRALLKWGRSAEGKKVIVVYSCQLPLLKACIRARKHIENLKLCLIVPDLIQHMGGPRGLLYRLNRERNTKAVGKCYPEIDAFVLLSEHMKTVLPVGEKPWIVIEGIYNGSFQRTETRPDKKIVFYAGTLAERYGIKNLIHAFCRIQDPELRLVLCGSGDTEAFIKETAGKDPRIVFKGMLERKEVLRLQKEATLLVNPRPPGDEFTKYSFPSKTMEYLGSGTPALFYRLPGIPEEYYDYCYTPEDTSVEKLAEKIEEICSSDRAVLEEKGMAAQRFIRERKTPAAQCRKFAELLNHLLK